MRPRPELTHERLLSIVEYDPETGIFRYRVRRGNVPAGALISRKSEFGHTIVTVDRRMYRAGRVAWFIMTGEWPPDQIDHRNGIADDDRWVNLRLATASQNQWNTRCKSKRPGALKGAFYQKQIGRWYSQIMKNGKMYRLGMFATAEEAHAAYVAKAEELFGEFAITRR